jgi:hypothetical protein
LGVEVRYKNQDGSDSDFPRVIEWLSLRELAGTSKVPTVYAKDGEKLPDVVLGTVTPVAVAAEPEAEADLDDIPF